MKTGIVLLILIAIYFSFLFSDGLLYSAVEETLDWFNAEHEKTLYSALVVLLSGLAAYLFTLEKSDKRRQEKLTDELILIIKNTGAYATTTDNTGFGEVHLEATITFKDSGFILRIKQIPSNDQAINLLDKKFLSWNELVTYIESETQFSLEDFLNEASPELQLPQKDAHAE
jgi:hypothetical protein